MSGLLTAPHENVRIQVVQLLKHVMKNVLSRKGDLEAIRLRELLDSPEIVILLPQEIYVSPKERKRIDMALSNKIIFEIKGSEKELEQVAEDARRKYLGSEIARDAEYFIATNYDWWKIYRVKRAGAEPQLELLYDGRRDGAIDELKQIIAQLPQLRIYPLPQNVVLLYKQNAEEIEKKLMSVFKDAKEDWRVKPLYSAYKTVMKMLYGEASEEFFEDLFIKHTYMHMVVLASLTKVLGKTGCPTDVASGVLLDVNVALPYLNWWKVFSDDDRVRSVIDEIVLRASLIDWEAGLTEDVFRALYEELIEPDTRRKIGEYYTPIWLVDFILQHFNLKNKTVLDPFCGSGTFLVRAFHRKVESGEDVDKAFYSLVGYDVNPLAVAVARAELILAYVRKARKEPGKPPHIYHIDTLAMWFGKGQISPSDADILASSARSYIEVLVSFGAIRFEDVLEEVSSIEQLITRALRYAYSKCDVNRDCLEMEINKHIDELGRNFKSDLVKRFIEHSKKAQLALKLAELIVRYGGNDVWGLVMASIYASTLLTRFKPDIVVTNPPWIPTTEYRAPYADRIRKFLLDKVGGLLDGRRQEALSQEAM